MSIQNEPRAVSAEWNKETVEFIRKDRCVTVNKIAAKLAIGHSSVEEMIQSLVIEKFVPARFHIY